MSPHARGARSGVMRVAGSGAVLRRLAGSFSPGTVPVAISTAISGLAVYGFLGVTARVLAPEDYAPLSVLWSLVFILGPGLFVPLEQEVARTVAARAVTGRLAGSALRRAIAIGALASLVIGAAVAALAPVLAVHLFAGRVELAIALSLTVPGMAAVHLTRGVLAGQGRFRGYALLVAAEAVLRFVAAALLAFAGVHAVEEYGFAVGAAPALAVLSVVLVLRPALPAVRDVIPWRRVSEGLGYLLVGSLGLQLLINAGPLAVQILAGSDQPDAAGRLLAALVLTRIPLYMFQAVQAALVPGLAASVSANDTGAFRSSVLRLLAMIAGLTAVALVAVLIAGPEALRTLFGPGFVLGRMDLCLLTLASSTLMAAQACGAALVSVHRHAKSSLGWALGVLAFVLACFWQGPLLARVELALLAGAVVSAVVLALTLGQTMRRHRA